MVVRSGEVVPCPGVQSPVPPRRNDPGFDPSKWFRLGCFGLGLCPCVASRLRTRHFVFWRNGEKVRAARPSSRKGVRRSAPHPLPRPISERRFQGGRAAKQEKTPTPTAPRRPSKNRRRREINKQHQHQQHTKKKTKDKREDEHRKQKNEERAEKTRRNARSAKQARRDQDDDQLAQ